MSLDTRVHHIRKIARDLAEVRERVIAVKARMASAAKRHDLVRVASVGHQLRAMLAHEAALSAEFDQVSQGLKFGTAPAGRPPALRMADCHPDRKHYAKGKCASCIQAVYRERREARIAREYHERETARRGTP
jgi:hypothetical protein